ncbi:MAG: VOC family protein [Armatimonadota bacterium]
MAEHTATVHELVPLLFVDDIEGTVSFYRDRLGFQVVQEARWGGKLGWCRLERQNAALMLQQATEEDEPAQNRGLGVGFYFICDDADAIYAELLSRGMQLDPPQTAYYGMRQLYMKDPDGYIICFESPIDTA